MTEETKFQHEFFDTSGVDNFKIKNVGKPPEGYPKVVIPDSYTDSPFAPTYEERKMVFLNHCLNNPSGTHIKGFYYELVRLHMNKGPIHQSLLQGVLDYVNDRYDCSDFVLLGIVRILYQFFDSELLDLQIKTNIEQTILDFKYHPEEPGIDSMCYWTENHQIMFATNAYLAGQMFPDKVFTNSGQTGEEKMKRSKPRIIKWLEMRFQTGFSEWLSHVYYDEDITALLNLVDFCGDLEIADLSAMILDLMFFDMAVNSRKGVFGCSHGRSYAEEKRNALVEATIDTQKLLFGTGIFTGSDNMGAVVLALSENYQLPKVIFDIATDDQTSENRQRMGIKVKEAAKWGLSFSDRESGMAFLSLEAYTHPACINLIMTLFDDFRWWQNQFFQDFAKNRKLIQSFRKLGLLPLLAKLLEKDLTRNTREEVNLYTYKTRDYLLSSAQDYRKGYGGDQQHIWQATLGPKAVCFTTHPGHKENTSAGYWVGSGNLPRVGQYKNVLIASYRISKMPGLYMTNQLFFTHAWFPKSEFDQVKEVSGWVFGRKGEGYIALTSCNKMSWQTEGEDKDKEILTEGLKNTWICELGNKEDNESFDAFVKSIVSAQLAFKGESVIYHSPSRGKIRFGWKGPLKVNGKAVSIKNYPRYDNPYCQADFAANEVKIQLEEQHLILDLKNRMKTVSSNVT
ncbi:hypothetical protein KJ966_02630 [bacterium]|nr:hypothetical protein [bacterium]